MYYQRLCQDPYMGHNLNLYFLKMFFLWLIRQKRFLLNKQIRVLDQKTTVSVSVSIQKEAKANTDR